MKKEITVKENDSGQRLDRFLMKMFPSLKAGNINKAIRNKDIKLNGKRTEAAYRLENGDKIYLFLPDYLIFEQKKNAEDFMSAGDGLSIVYEDENILLVDKEQGLVVHADDDNTSDTLINRIKKYLYGKGEFQPENEHVFKPALCNRIDRNTSGIVIAAKNAEALRILNEKIKNREIEKNYLCIVLGKMPKAEDILTAYLEKDSAENSVTVSNKKTKSNLTVKTKYTVIESNNELSLLKIDLLTGRTHQIRAHMAYIGHPLLGDGKYGNNRVNTKYGFKMQALCSCKLTFRFTSDGGILNYLNNISFEVNEIPFMSFWKKINIKKKEGQQQ